MERCAGARWRRVGYCAAILGMKAVGIRCRSPLAQRGTDGSETSGSGDRGVARDFVGLSVPDRAASAETATARAGADRVEWAREPALERDAKWGAKRSAGDRAGAARGNGEP